MDINDGAEELVGGLNEPLRLLSLSCVKVSICILEDGINVEFIIWLGEELS